MEPDGMSNGWAMKLLKPQAITATRRTKRSSEPAVSFFLVFAVAGFEPVRAEDRAAIDRFFPPRLHWSSRGGKVMSAHYVRRRCSNQQSNGSTSCSPPNPTG